MAQLDACDKCTSKNGSCRLKLDGTRSSRSNWIHRNTITNIEVNRYAGDPASLSLIEKVLKRAGIEFIEENGGGPGVRLKDRQTKGR